MLNIEGVGLEDLVEAAEDSMTGKMDGVELEWVVGVVNSMAIAFGGLGQRG